MWVEDVLGLARIWCCGDIDFKGLAVGVIPSPRLVAKNASIAPMKDSPNGVLFARRLFEHQMNS